ncbi:MAG: glycosyltransferase [Phycisphaerales bacterium]|nr:glycosyltransferase [Phycisphaerales bacterium]
MPNYNHAVFLKKSVSGLINQRRAADEILILDDASTDNSIEIIEEAIDNEPNVRLIKLKENKGVIHALNRLLEEASGDWIGFPAADDFLFPQFLNTVEPLILQSTKVGFVSACVEIWDENDKKTGVRPIFYPSLSPKIFSPREAKKLLRESDNHFLGQVTLYRKDALRKLGGFDEKFGSGTDGLALRRLALTMGFGFVPQRCGIWRLHGSNYSLTSAFNIPKYKKSIEQHKTHVDGAPSDMFPDNYSDLIARRMKFGAARLLLNGEMSFASAIDKVAVLIDAGYFETEVLKAFSFAGSQKRALVLMWLFLRLWPFSPFRFAIQPLRRRIAERRGSLANTK